MNLFRLILLLFLFAACKSKKVITPEMTPAQERTAETTDGRVINPDECLIKATVIKKIDDSNYSLKVNRILSQGFGFKAILNAGHEIDCKADKELKTGENLLFTIEWVEAMGGGYYQINGTEKL